MALECRERDEVGKSGGRAGNEGKRGRGSGGDGKRGGSRGGGGGSGGRGGDKGATDKDSSQDAIDPQPYLKLMQASCSGVETVVEAV